MKWIAQNKATILALSILVMLVSLVFWFWAEIIVNINYMHPNVQAFLKMIRYAEGTSGPNGYRTLFGGGLFESYDTHPRIRVCAQLGSRQLCSTAAGAYQILSGTYDDARRGAGVNDFTPESQDKLAVELIRRRGALAMVVAGDFDSAVQKCRKEWASLPGAGYNQPEKSLAELKSIYEQNGGSYA